MFWINEEIIEKMIEMENIKALERVYKIKKELITKINVDDLSQKGKLFVLML